MTSALRKLGIEAKVNGCGLGEESSERYNYVDVDHTHFLQRTSKCRIIVRKHFNYSHGCISAIATLNRFKFSGSS
jgi:hypothetical protein